MGKKLSDVIGDLVSGKSANAILSRGLMFQVKAAEAGEDNRLLCYRRSSAPSSDELRIVRGELEKLVGPTFLGSELSYRGQDGVERRGFVFSWPQVAQQLEMDLGAARRHLYGGA